MVNILLKKLTDVVLDHNFRALKTAIIQVSKGIQVALEGERVATRPVLNFIQSGAVTITVVENDVENRIDITIDA